jgi:peptidoglycan-associated lipoprotein
MNKLLLSALLMSLLAACGSQPTKPEAKAAPSKATAATNAAAINPLNDPHNILSHRSVYYDFDKSIVKAEYKPMIKAHAEYMVSHASAKVQLQGNCDERGSREYNLALGQRRADSVKQLMEAAGVSGSRLSTVSYGSEKPRALGHNEEAWAQNRRTDIVYQSE